MLDPGQQVRLALRTFAARRGLFAIRVVTLALVVGAGSAVFLVADAMLLRPLPFKHAERLVRVFTQPPGRPDFAHANPLHPLEFLRFRERPGILERLEGIWAAERAVGGDGEPESMPAASVSAGLFDSARSLADPRPDVLGRRGPPGRARRRPGPRNLDAAVRRRSGDRRQDLDDRSAAVRDRRRHGPRLPAGLRPVGVLDSPRDTRRTPHPADRHLHSERRADSGRVDDRAGACRTAGEARGRYARVAGDAQGLDRGDNGPSAGPVRTADRGRDAPAGRRDRAVADCHGEPRQPDAGRGARAAVGHRGSCGARGLARRSALAGGRQERAHRGRGRRVRPAAGDSFSCLRSPRSIRRARSGHSATGCRGASWPARSALHC